MTPAEAEAIGRRWIAAGGGWREGMRDGDGYIVTGVGDDGIPEASGIARTAKESHTFTPWTDAWPDPLDPATVGAMLGVVRERWGRPDLCIRSNRAASNWRPDCVGTPDALLNIDAPSEPAALLAALEAAPKEKP